MAQHRLERPPRLRANYRRIAVAGVALVVTLIALLGGMGVIPVQKRPPAVAGTPADAGLAHLPAGSGAAPNTAARSAVEGPGLSGSAKAGTVLQAGTGSGRRIVFDMSDQRVWLVSKGDKVLRTYLVSGSLTDNLHPGTYAVYSKSRWALGVDESGVMQYFVRFTRGAHAAIGFHSIPTRNGRPLQTRADLGSPQSHGCIRQLLPDAIHLWEFAPVGTRVVVTA
jgi:hypothetical protein